MLHLYLSQVILTPPYHYIYTWVYLSLTKIILDYSYPSLKLYLNKDTLILVELYSTTSITLLNYIRITLLQYNNFNQLEV